MFHAEHSSEIDFKNYKKAIEYYSKVLSRIDNNSSISADILYRRGGSYERLKAYKKAEMFRWFVSGDCDSEKLRDAIFNTARELNHLIHYSYTKNLPLFLDVKKPENYRLTASIGGRFDHLINPVDFPRNARVVQSLEEAAKLNLPVDKKDDLAYGPIDQPFALLYH